MKTVQFNVFMIFIIEIVVRKPGKCFSMLFMIFSSVVWFSLHCACRTFGRDVLRRGRDAAGAPGDSGRSQLVLSGVAVRWPASVEWARDSLEQKANGWFYQWTSARFWTRPRCLDRRHEKFRTLPEDWICSFCYFNPFRPGSALQAVYGWCRMQVQGQHRREERRKHCIHGSLAGNTWNIDCWLIYLRYWKVTLLINYLSIHR